jgi:hypothetical protein
VGEGGGIIEEVIEEYEQGVVEGGYETAGVRKGTEVEEDRARG